MQDGDPAARERCERVRQTPGDPLELLRRDLLEEEADTDREPRRDQHLHHHEHREKETHRGEIPAEHGAEALEPVGGTGADDAQNGNGGPGHTATSLAPLSEV